MYTEQIPKKNKWESWIISMLLIFKSIFKVFFGGDVLIHWCLKNLIIDDIYWVLHMPVTTVGDLYVWMYLTHKNLCEIQTINHFINDETKTLKD